MRRMLKNALAGAMHRLKDHAELVGLANVDEFTFRSLVLAEIMRRDTNARCQTEWHRFDLLVQRQTRNAIIEFKFYLNRKTVEVDGTSGDWKGGAGKKNEKEFWACVRKLHQDRNPRIHNRYLVLVYDMEYPKRSPCSFVASYDGLAPSREIKSVTRITHCLDTRLACKLIEVA